MDGQDVLDGFQFEKNGVLDDDVGLEASVHAHVFVEDWQGHLLLEREAGAVELPAEALLVDGFQEAWAELTVDLYGEADDGVG